MQRLILTLSISVLTTLNSAMAADWNQAAGPNQNFTAGGSASETFSGTTGENILWRTPLPNTGQGTAIVSRGRIFVTSHEPITRDTETGSMILGMCFDASSGKELWRRELPGTRVTDLSSLFSDNTAASPISDGERVLFVNVGGTLSCFDYEGLDLWSRKWGPFGRHHARQHEPILHTGRAILMQVPRDDLPASVTTKEGAKPLGRDREYWTHLQAFDLQTGKREWVAEAGTSVHTTSMIGTLHGKPALLTGRGGGHQPPEEPYGLSLISAEDGSTIWDLPLAGYGAAQNACWNEDVACVFQGREHLTVEIASGRILSRVSITEDVTVRRMEDSRYVTADSERLAKIRRPITRQSNILIGPYHYFRAHDDFLIGRVDIRDNSVEYLQVPVQVVRDAKQPGAETVRWKDAIPNDMQTADGFVSTQDRRNAGNGWGHVQAASPIVVGEHVYLPTMIGMVYVLKWNAEHLDENALVSISDLGPAGETWSLSSLSFSEGRLFARTLKELICIGPTKK